MTGTRTTKPPIVFIVYCLWGAAEHRLSGAIVSCCDDNDDDDDDNAVYADDRQSHELY